MGFGDGDDAAISLAYAYDLDTLLSLADARGRPRGRARLGVACRVASPHYFWGAVDASVTDRGTRASVGCGRAVAGGPGVHRDEPHRGSSLRPARRAARRAAGHPGQRRHRQDVHARRARHPVRRRAGRDRVRAARRHLHPCRHRRAARPRARPAGRAAAAPRGRRPTGRLGERRRRAHGRTSPRSDRELRLARLERAVTEFDAATITTIHGFATQVLGTLGATAGTDPDATLVDDAAELAAEAVRRRARRRGHRCHPADAPAHVPARWSRAPATRSTSPTWCSRPTPTRTAPRRRQAAARRARGQRSIDLMRRRRRGAGTLSFDDILVELRARSTARAGAAAVETLRRRFRVALIDEFQDTDPVQWDIFRTLFGDAGAPRRRWSWSATRSRRSTPSAGPTCTPTSTRSTPARAPTALARHELALRRRGARRPRACCSTGTTFGDDADRVPPVAAAPSQRRAAAARPTTAQPLPALSLRLALDPDLNAQPASPATSTPMPRPTRRSTATWSCAAA